MRLTAWTGPEWGTGQGARHTVHNNHPAPGADVHDPSRHAHAWWARYNLQLHSRTVDGPVSFLASGLFTPHWVVVDYGRIRRNQQLPSLCWTAGGDKDRRSWGIRQDCDRQAPVTGCDSSLFRQITQDGIIIGHSYKGTTGQGSNTGAFLMKSIRKRFVFHPFTVPIFEKYVSFVQLLITTGSFHLKFSWKPCKI